MYLLERKCFVLPSQGGTFYAGSLLFSSSLRNSWEGGAWFEETVDHGVCGLRCQVREAMMSPVKVPKPCQAKDEAKREQEQEGMKSHTGPRCLK